MSSRYDWQELGPGREVAYTWEEPLRRRRLLLKVEDRSARSRRSTADASSGGGGWAYRIVGGEGSLTGSGARATVREVDLNDITEDDAKPEAVPTDKRSVQSAASSDGLSLAVRVWARGPIKVLTVTSANFAGSREGDERDAGGGALRSGKGDAFDQKKLNALTHEIERLEAELGKERDLEAKLVSARARFALAHAQPEVTARRRSQGGKDLAAARDRTIGGGGGGGSKEGSEEGSPRLLGSRRKTASMAWLFSHKVDEGGGGGVELRRSSSLPDGLQIPGTLRAASNGASSSSHAGNEVKLINEVHAGSLDESSLIRGSPLRPLADGDGSTRLFRRRKSTSTSSLETSSPPPSFSDPPAAAASVSSAAVSAAVARPDLLSASPLGASPLAVEPPRKRHSLFGSLALRTSGAALASSPVSPAGASPSSFSQAAKDVRDELPRLETSIAAFAKANGEAHDGGRAWRVNQLCVQVIAARGLRASGANPFVAVSVQGGGRSKLAHRAKTAFGRRGAKGQMRPCWEERHTCVHKPTIALAFALATSPLSWG